MNKFGAVLIIIVLVVAAYVFLLAVMPVIVDLASTANTTMSETSNMTYYPGAQAGVLAAPLVMFFVPAVIGIVTVIIVLKKKP